MPPAISIESLGKRYLVDHEAPRGYRTLRESLVNLASAPFRRLRGKRSATREEFWALKDVSFDVQPGEVVGIIGRNGAGKSTLLKILSQITKPTSGRVWLNGRVGSLLEVGTGFHPELTGRENIYLNGSILGMTRHEIARKFDEIVTFAEIEKFLDTPVKRYSSGMYVRLAFAVAAHLEPEILIVDEVLAVGDHTFQKKCLQRMGDVASHGATVLLVSHDLAMISRLSSKVVWLKNGSLQSQGIPKAVLDEYTAQSLLSNSVSPIVDLQLAAQRSGKRAKLLQSLTLTDASSDPTLLIPAGETVNFTITFDAANSPRDLGLSIDISDIDGRPITQIGTGSHGPAGSDAMAAGQVTCCIPVLRLVPGEYSISVRSGDTEDYIDVLEDVTRITVVPSDYFGTGRLPRKRFGHMLCDAHWTAAQL